MLKCEVISANEPECMTKLRVTAKGDVLLYRPIAAYRYVCGIDKVAVVVGHLVKSTSNFEIGDHVDRSTWMHAKPFYGEVKLIQE